MQAAKPLQDRVAVVTGSGKGIGKGIAMELAAAGACVVINYSASEQGARQVQGEITAAGGEAIMVKADVSNETEVCSLMNEAYQWHKRLDILVCNAALQANVTLGSYSMETYDSLVAVNLVGYWLCTREAAKYMIPQGRGVILYNSSVHAKRPTHFDPVYCMTKGGIKMLERESAIELAPNGIRVLCMEPGGVRIDEPKSGSEGRWIDRKYIVQPKQFRFQPRDTHRYMEPSDMGKMAVILAGDDCELIRGCEVAMDAGDMLY